MPTLSTQMLFCLYFLEFTFLHYFFKTNQPFALTFDVSWVGPMVFSNINTNGNKKIF